MSCKTERKIISALNNEIKFEFDMYSNSCPYEHRDYLRCWKRSQHILEVVEDIVDENGNIRMERLDEIITYFL